MARAVRAFKTDPKVFPEPSTPVKRRRNERTQKVVLKRIQRVTEFLYKLITCFSVYTLTPLMVKDLSFVIQA